MKKSIVLLLKMGTALLLLTSILPSLFPNIWFIDVLASFKFQLIITSILLFVTNILSKKNKTIGTLLFIMTIWNLSFMYSLYFPNRFGEIVKGKGTSILSINLLTNNNQSDKVIELISDTNPDILVLLEYNSKWDALLSQTISNYEYQKKVVRNDPFGIGYFSKIASKNIVLNFDQSGVPSVRSDMEINGKKVTILATHPQPPLGQQNFELRNSHLETIGKKRNQFEPNLIVAGDLNTSSYSTHFRNFIKETELKDSRNGFGQLTTWPANFKLLKTTLDHFLVSEKIHVMHRNVLRYTGSDHLPIYMEFSINN